ncbi:MAG TPA: hypothetical protein VFR86_12185 [Burkholderiaceae bacterium]|nr:hypothetical protein [Burkholderiaceae bacterium]
MQKPVASANAADAGALAHSLLNLLDEERELLVAGHAEPLAALTAHKQRLLQDLSSALRGLPAGQRSGLAALLERARSLNDFNAHLLAPRLIAVRARTDALLRAADAAVYGADGATRQTVGARTTASA